MFPSGIAHVALFDFVGKDSRELSVRQGELVYVTQKESLGWVKVVNAENYRGWVPSSFLVLVSQSQLASTQQTVEVMSTILSYTYTISITRFLVLTFV